MGLKMNRNALKMSKYVAEILDKKAEKTGDLSF